MDEKRQDRIDDYILGRMSAEDCEKFRLDLTEDAELREQYNFTRLVKETISEQIELEELMKKWDEEIEEEQYGRENPVAACASVSVDSVNRKLNRRKAWFWVSGVAAVLLIGLFVVRMYDYSEVGPQYESIMEGTVVRAAGNELYQIDSLIVHGAYEKAFVRIEAMEAEMASAFPIMFKGVDSLDAERMEQLEYEQQEFRQWSEDLMWMKVYALLGLNRKEEALTLLEHLRNSNGCYREKADSLFNAIK